MVETYRNNADFMPTPESARNWTETSSNSKLIEINAVLNNSKLENIDEVKNLKDKIKNREYREFQRELWISYNKCDWKLWVDSLIYFNIYINKLYKKYSVILDTQSSLSALRLDLSSNAIDTTRIQRAEERYLSTHETMDESTYNKLFSWKEKLQQWQLGDCYLVSGIHELANAQHFDTLMRTSIKRMQWKNWDLWYQIKIPLWEPSWRKILIKDSELKVAKIRGNNWYKLLELAYAKNKLRKNDRNWNAYAPITSSELGRIAGWWTHEVLSTFLWKNNIGFCDFGTMKNYWARKKLSQTSESTKKEIYNFLRNYDPNIWNRFVSLASMLWTTDHESYVVGGKRIYCRHAYSVSWVKKDNKGKIISITVLNPWNTDRTRWGSYQDFTLNEFYNAFSCVSCGKIKTSTFLDNKSRG